MTQMISVSKTHPLIIVHVLYAMTLLFLLSARPFWLDEVLQLGITSQDDFHLRLESVRETPGAAPLGYEVQRWFVRALEWNRQEAARIPSAIFSILALAVLLVTRKRLAISDPITTAVLWIFIPLQLRYAVEARPYSQALLLSALSTFLFFVSAGKSARWAMLYAVTVGVAMYSQPYTIFLQLGLLAASGLHRWRDRDMLLRAGGLALGGALFLPWFLYSFSYWHAYGAERPHTSPNPGTILVELRELSGGGYVCSGVFLILVVAGAVSNRIREPVRRHLVGGAAAALLFPLVGDAALGYFFAIRQAIFALVPLVLLAAGGLTEIKVRWGRAQLGVILLFMTAAMAKNVTFFRDHSENWKAAAQVIEVDSRNGCVMDADMPLYAVFEPAINDRKCRQLGSVSHVVLPISKYMNATEVATTAQRLESLGYRIDKVTPVGNFEIRDYKL
jgi:hypothetical protein